MMFEHPTYIVLQIPPPISESVVQLRKQADAVFPPLPVEITVAGSSGIGPVEREECRDQVFATLSDLAAKTAPLHASFHSIERFPSSPVAYLSLTDPTPFLALHQAILRTKIRFCASPFPFRPHCTIRSHGAGLLDEVEFKRVSALPVPREAFQLETMSVYELDGGKRECRRLYWTTLAAR